MYKIVLSKKKIFPDKIKEVLEALFVFTTKFNTDFITRIDPILFDEPESEQSKTYETEIFNSFLSQNLLKLHRGFKKEDRMKIFIISLDIFEDDRIDNIKLKVLKGLREYNRERFVHYSQLYFSVLQYQNYNSRHMFQSLTQNEDITELSKVRFKNYANNIKEFKKHIPEKDNYTYDDIINLDKYINEKSIVLKETPLDIVYQLSNDYPCCANVFDVKEDMIDTYLLENIDKILKTYQKKTLVEIPMLYDKFIIINDIQDVWEYVSHKKLPAEYFTKVYYPYLAKRGIFTKEQWKPEELNDETYSLINDSFDKYNRHIKLFYELYNNYGNYKNVDTTKGLQKLTIWIKQNSKMIIPLENIFKMIQTTEKMSLIKYNPGKKRDKLFRIYSLQKTTDGLHIPLLKKSVINRLKDMIGKIDSVSFYIHLDNGDKKNSELRNELYFTLFTDGSIKINYSRTTPFTIVKMMNDINNLVQPILFKIKYFIMQSGIHFNTFNDSDDLDYKRIIQNPNIYIEDIQYLIKTKVERKIDFTSFQNCLKDIFRLENETCLYYKRVGYYSELDTINQFITDKVRDRESRDIIIGLLINKFSLSNKEAQQKLSEWYNKVTITRAPTQTTKLDIKTNQGIKVDILYDKFSNVNIVCSNINNIKYITILNKYINVLLNITQNPEKIDYDMIKSVCDSSIEEYEGGIDDVGQPVQKTLKTTQTDLITAMDDNTEDEEQFILMEDDEEEEEEQVGGKTDELDMRRKTLDNKLYKDAVGYTRACQKNRQPIIVSEEEKKKIDELYGDKYKGDNTLTYGSEEHKNYYLCPRYWCIPDKIPVATPEQCSGGVDKVIEFSNLHKYPGFLSKDNRNVKKHPLGLCYPCCFKTPVKEERIKECAVDVDKKKDEDTGKILKTIFTIDTITKNNVYISGFKYPLHIGHWGMVSTSIQKIFQTPMNDIFVPGKGNKLKNKFNCLLRYGVENSSSHSFIGCLCSLFKYIDDDTFELKVSVDIRKKEHRVPTIKQMIQYLKKYVITFDTFVKYNSGVLVDLFEDSDNKIKENYNSSLELIKNNKIYKYYIHKIEESDENTEELRDYLNKLVYSYLRFCSYLDNNNNIIVDYTYLWEFITTPHHKLFPDGLNLAILNMSVSDNTNNVEIICPKMIMKVSPWDKNKKTLVIIKNDIYYEPLFYYNRNVDKGIHTISKVLDGSLKQNIDDGLEHIRRIMNSCRAYNPPLPPTSNSLKYNIELSEVEKIIDELPSYKIQKQLSNLQNRTIAIKVIFNEEQHFVIPIFPSNPSTKYPLQYIQDNEDELWRSYQETKQLITKLYNDSNERIPCNLKYKCTIDDMIIGVMTETLQLIRIYPNIPNYEDDLEEYNMTPIGGDDIDIDKELALLTNNTLEKRTHNFIKLEQQFFSLFRNTIRIVLNDYKFIRQRKKLENIISSSEPYLDKLDKVEVLLKKLLKDKIKFIDFEENVREFNNFYTCYHKNKNQCNNFPLCSLVEEEITSITPTKTISLFKEQKTELEGDKEPESDAESVGEKDEEVELEPETEPETDAESAGEKDEEVVLETEQEPETDAESVGEKKQKTEEEPETDSESVGEKDEEVELEGETEPETDAESAEEKDEKPEEEPETDVENAEEKDEKPEEEPETDVESAEEKDEKPEEEPETEAESVGEKEQKTEEEPETEPETDAESSGEKDEQIELEGDTEPETEPETDAESVEEKDEQVVLEGDTEPESVEEKEQKTEEEPETDAESVGEKDEEVVLEGDTEPETEPETDAESSGEKDEQVELEGDTEPETETEQESSAESQEEDSYGSDVLSSQSGGNSSKDVKYICALKLPKTNLVTGLDNERLYYSFISDEIVRNGRIRQYLLYPQTQMILENIEYKIHSNEFIIQQSLLTTEYLSKLVKEKQNPYVTSNSYYTLKPKNSSRYNKNYKLNNIP